MFRPARMSKLKVVVLEDYVEKVLRELGRTGDVQVIDVRGESVEDVGSLGFIKSFGDYGRIEELSRIILRLDGILNALAPGSTSQHLPISDVSTLRKTLVPVMEKIEGTLKEQASAVEEMKVLKVKAYALKKAVELGVTSSWLSGEKKIYAVAGTIERADIPELAELLREKTGGSYLMFPDQENGENSASVVLVTAEEHKNDVNYLLDNVKFARYNLSEGVRSPKEELALVEKTRSTLQKKKARLDADLASFKGRNASDLAYFREVLGTEKRILEAKSFMGKTKTVSILECWAPSKKVAFLTKRFEELTDGSVLVTETQPKAGEDIPVMLDNPSFIKPFEVITRSYGVPGYYEVDPTFFLAVSFPLIFGMMFGDVGHGAVMTAMGLLVGRLRRGDAVVSDFARIFTYCGITSVCFGFLYGSVFGLEGILHPIWLSPIHQLKEGLIVNLFGLALFVGFVQMLLGILIDSANKVYSSGLRRSAIGSAARIFLFFGVVALITRLFGFPIPFFGFATTMPEHIVFGLGFLLPAILIVGGEVSHHIRGASLLGVAASVGNGLFEYADSITMFMSNTISYSRIVILALIHAFLSEVVYLLGGLARTVPYVGLPLYYATLFAGTLVLIIGLEGLVVYVHTIRLHFYEWFNKFYGGRGVPYKPFKVASRYVTQEM